MGALETLVASAREREAADRAREIRQTAELEETRRQRDVKKVREVAMRTFTPELLRQLMPAYDPGKGNIRPSMRFKLNGLNFALLWREFLWAEPGHEDYLEGYQSDGTAVQFSPDFPRNDEKLALLIDSFKIHKRLFSFLFAGL